MIPEGVKWNGKSRHQLKQKMDAADNVGFALVTIQREMEVRIKELRLEANKEILKLIERDDLDPEELYVTMFEKCDESVTGTCIFDTREDPWNDECIFCNQPLDKG